MHYYGAALKKHGFAESRIPQNLVYGLKEYECMIRSESTEEAWSGETSQITTKSELVILFYDKRLFISCSGNAHRRASNGASGLKDLCFEESWLYHYLSSV